MKRTITQKKIANELGVSPTAVSFCLNGKKGVSESLRKKVLALAEKRHCTNKNLPIAIVFPDNVRPVGRYTQHLINELTNQCRQRNMSVAFLSNRNEKLLRSDSFRGVISLDYSGYTGLKLPQKEALPIISINDISHPIDGVFCVCSDEQKMFRLLFERLIKKGHTRIGYCYTEDSRPGLFSGVRQQSMREVAAGFVNLNIFEGTFGTTHPMLETILKLCRKKITALIVAGESSEFRARQALELLNVRVPDELALVTWENPGESELYVPPQTTVGQDFPLIVKTTLDNLDALIAGKTIRNTFIDYLLHDRESW